MIAALTGENPYRALLEAVREILQAAYPDMQARAESRRSRCTNTVAPAPPSLPAVLVDRWTWKAKSPDTAPNALPTFTS